ncbi:hypothetical protein WT21_29970 [Burkholderia territorii]|uniref:hypothetical protein n=1 Tax=Burkholderia territorii TaxID=1503055 RepID=UPI00075C4112|nr:hypothetical protein [Burkholderia territorii]KVG53752.1 hypothetical protein WS79_29130 [Burkholderia territorii]KVL51607.1 hypothetical protein WS99_15935 [Burkholderia territorii]KVQ38981.1 hypothetical protein WT21_29970 [Burkholderia territorii]
MQRHDGTRAVRIEAVLADTVGGDGVMGNRRHVGARVTVDVRSGTCGPGRECKCLSRIGEAIGTPDELF